VSLDSKRAAIHEKLTFDLPYFAREAPLLIKNKDGGLVALNLNNAQKLVHDHLEAQLRSRGFVRALILKGRQQGVSTYVNARFYHKARRGGINAFILSHEASTTDKLFKMVRRFHENVHPSLRPETSNSSRKELVFNKIESEYFIGTAGNPDVGRGGTLQLFHGSEAHFWANTDEIESGVMESVPPSKGEIILESTANGMTGMFYEKCMTALEGRGDYELIFVPWFLQAEYRRPLPEGFELTDAEIELKGLYKLDDEQICWRRFKIDNARNGLKQFQQEYPCNVMEAFQTSSRGLIDPEWVMRARKSRIKDAHAPLVFGVDPARSGGDKTTICFRRGREVPVMMSFDDMDEMRLAGILGKLIDKYKPVKCFVDVAYGHGTIDRLKELGYSGIVDGIHFGMKADMQDVYMNKRAEMWCELRDWLKAGDVGIVDDEILHSDLTIMPDFITTSNGKIRLVGKDEIRKEFKRSPDRGDALALTFAMPIRRDAFDGGREIKRKSSDLVKRPSKKQEKVIFRF